MELIFFPGGNIIVFIFLFFVICCASVAMGFLFFVMAHMFKQFLFKITPAGKKLSVGMGVQQRGFDKWPWYLTDKPSWTFGIIGALLFFYSILGPLAHLCGLDWR